MQSISAMFSKSKLLKKKKAKKARANKHTMWFSKREFNNTFILVQGKKKKKTQICKEKKRQEKQLVQSLSPNL